MAKNWWLKKCLCLSLASLSRFFMFWLSLSNSCTWRFFLEIDIVFDFFILDHTIQYKKNFNDLVISGLSSEWITLRYHILLAVPLLFAITTPNLNSSIQINFQVKYYLGKFICNLKKFTQLLYLLIHNAPFQKTLRCFSSCVKDKKKKKLKVKMFFLVD